MVSTINTWAWMKHEYRHQQNCWKETTLKMNFCCGSRSPNHNNQGDNSMNDDQIIRPRLRFHLNAHIHRHRILKDYSSSTIKLKCQTVACDFNIALSVTVFLGSPQAKCIMRIFTLLYILVDFLQDSGRIATCSLR